MGIGSVPDPVPWIIISGAKYLPPFELVIFISLICPLFTVAVQLVSNGSQSSYVPDFPAR